MQSAVVAQTFSKSGMLNAGGTGKYPAPYDAIHRYLANTRPVRDEQLPYALEKVL